MRWTERWLGKAWVEGRYDCGDFVEEVLRVEFGRDLRLPAHAADPGAWDAQIAANIGAFAARTIAPQDGDASGTSAWRRSASMARSGCCTAAAAPTRCCTGPRISRR